MMTHEVLGRVMRPSKEAESHLFKALEIARSNEDSAHIYDNLSMLSRAFLYDSAFAKAKQCALECVEQYGDYAYCDAYYNLSRAYAALGQVDSAKYYLSLAPKPEEGQQQVSQLVT